MVSTDYAFVPMTTADLPLIRRWLETPHVSQWWHDPAEQFELVSGDLDHPDMAQYIVASDRRPFAYLQCYNLSDWNTGFGPQPLGTRGLDQFIGEADMLGRGHVEAGVSVRSVAHDGDAQRLEPLEGGADVEDRLCSRADQDDRDLRQREDVG